VTENSVPIEGMVATEEGHPFSGDTISGTVKQTYTGTCGSSGHGHGGGKKVNKGSFTGTITIS
jgi:hypothetical protein